MKKLFNGRKVLWGLGIFLGILFTIRLILPLASELILEKVIAKYSPYHAEISDVSYDIWNGNFILDNMTLELNQAIKLKLNNFGFQVAYMPLFDGKIHIKKVDLSGFSSHVSFEDETINLAGMSLDSDKKGKEQIEPVEKQESKEDFSLPIFFDQIEMSDLNVTIQNKDQESNFLIKKLFISEINLENKELPIKIVLDSQLDKSNINLDGSIYVLDLQKKSNFKLKLEDLNLDIYSKLLDHYIPEGIELGGISNIQTDINFRILENKISSKVDSIIKFRKMDFKNKDQILSGDKIDIISNLDISVAKNDTKVIGKVKLESDNFLFRDNLTEIRSPDFVIEENINFLKSSDHNKIDLKGTSIFQSLIQKSPETSISIGQSTLSNDTKINGDKIATLLSGTIDKLLVYDEQNKENLLKSELLILEKVDIKSLNPISLVAEKLELNDFIMPYPFKNENIDYDKSVLSLRNFNLYSDHFYDKTPNPNGVLKLTSEIGSYGKIKINGTSKTEKDLTSEFKIKGSISALDLTNLSGFFMQQMGYRIEKGQLNSEFKIAKNKKDNLTGKVDITIAKIDVNNTDKRGTKIKNGTKIPLSSSLSMIKDKDDLIPLEFPVEGNSNSPSFSLRVLLTQKLSEVIIDQLGQALGNALVSNYLPMLASSVTMSPMLVVSLLKKGVDFATKLRFEPINFKKNSTILESKSKKQLAKVADTLNKKSELILNFCSDADPYENRESFENEKNSEKPSEAEIKSSFDLANKRLKKVSDFLIGVKKIAAKKIITCRPKLSEKKITIPSIKIFI